MGTSVRNTLFRTMGTINQRLSDFALRWFAIAGYVLCFPMSLSAVDTPKVVHEKKPQDTEVFRTVNDFMTSVRRGNIVKAYQSFTSHDFREKTTLGQLTSFISQSSTLRRNRSVALVKIQYHDNIAVAEVTLTSLEHDQANAQFILRYDEGHWRVISIQMLSHSL
jgi:hypothetical protein